MEVVRAAFRAMDERKEETLLPHLDPEVDWRPTPFLTGIGSYRGHDGVRQWLADLAELEEGGSHVVTEPGEFRDLGDGRVLVLGKGQVVRGLGTLARDLGWIWEIDDGRVVRMRNYLSHEEAEEAASEESR